MSLRGVEELPLERGIDVSYETIRRRVAKFGPAIALGLRRQPHPGDIWHLDAVGQNGVVLDEILQCRCNTKATKRLLLRLMKKHNCSSKHFVTDKL